MLFMSSRHELSIAGWVGWLQEEGEVLVGSDCPWQEELWQPTQRTVTPCSTIFAHVMPVFLPLSPPMLIGFAFKIKHISFKATTEPPLRAGCELGCARTAGSAASRCLTSYL